MTNSYRQLSTGSRGVLVCFPWVGAGSLPFRRWSPLMPEGVALWAARTAGKEDRLREPAPTDWDALVRELVDDLPSGVPMVFFGHCLGALIAFEMAVELDRRGLPTPERLMVVGAPPALSEGGQPPADAYEAAGESGAVPEHVLNDPDLFSLIAPMISSDLRLAARYRHTGGQQVNVPIDVLVASDAPPEETAAGEAWADVTSRGITLTVINGRSLMPHDAWTPLGELVARATTDALEFPSR